MQLPLPAHLDASALLARIPPTKDVEGLTERSAGRLALGKPSLVPCTPAGVMHLLDRAGVELEGAEAVVIDVGMHRLESGLCGDVDTERVAEVASAITPAPGGVGPMTIAMLLRNTPGHVQRRHP